MLLSEAYMLCAQIAHEAHRAWCCSMGDLSQMHWEDAPEWQRISCINGVKRVINGGNTPKQVHESWLREKEEHGWKYGPVKDANKREHPCIMPFDDLPPQQKAKDTLFVLTIQGVLLSLSERLGVDRK